MDYTKIHGKQSETCGAGMDLSPQPKGLIRPQAQSPEGRNCSLEVFFVFWGEQEPALDKKKGVEDDNSLRRVQSSSWVTEEWDGHSVQRSYGNVVHSINLCSIQPKPAQTILRLCDWRTGDCDRWKSEPGNQPWAFSGSKRAGMHETVWGEGGGGGGLEEATVTPSATPQLPAALLSLV